MIVVEGFPAPGGALSLRVARGEVVLLRGANGSGKTSLLRALAGLDAPLAPTRVRVDEADPRALPASSLPASLCPQDPRDALVGLTVEGEMRLRRAPSPPELDALRHRDCATLSSGEARRVGLAAARGRNASILLLDEPVEGLDAAGRAALRALVQRAAERGAVVAADHAGILDDLATCVVDLTPRDALEAAPIPRADGPPILRAPPHRARDRALPGVTLGPGFHALTGANGAGKSTLLLRLAGLIDANDVLIDGAPPRPGRNVRLALPHARDLFTRDGVREELDGADDLIVDALVPRALLDRHPHALSGGEAQRVSLAKCLGREARAYLLDEPEAHLDAQGRRALLACLARRVAEGACVLAATHDPALRALAHDVVHVEGSS